jgi:uncharacterized RDD family membrane protein YckC
MTGNALVFLIAFLLVMSITLIITATIFFWIDIGGKIGPYRRKLSLLFAVIGWAFYLLILMPDL